jgi:pimeloyl-ACP methyl ester carboxylesterase
VIRPLAVLSLLVAASACSGDSGPIEPTPAPVSAERCLVRLHGKGGDGGPASETGGVAVLSPRGNGTGWGGRQWLYFPGEKYAEAAETVVAATEGCDQVIINGFSNGGAFAARLLCSGEDLNGRLVRVVVDDPVTDAAANGCAPSPDVEVVLYWTSALEGTSRPGASCKDIDWTCEGGKLVGVDAFAASLGVTPKPSPHTEHAWFADAPELNDWD